MNENEEYFQPAITKRQIVEEARKRSGDYEIEKKKAVANCEEVEELLKNSIHKIHIWKEREDKRFEHNEYYKLIFGKESLIEEKEELSKLIGKGEKK